jgi:hypothetical protein
MPQNVGSPGGLRTALQEALSQHYQASGFAKEADATAKVWRDTAVDAFRAAGLKSTTFTVTLDGEELTIRATCDPDPEPIDDIDPVKLKKLMGSQWAKVTRPVLDADKLNQWMLDGSQAEQERRHQLVAQATVRKPPRTPFPHYSVQQRRAKTQTTALKTDLKVVEQLDIPDLEVEDAPPPRRRRMRIAR